ncbi:hypothetical protein PFISCL1PPCAC_5503, partial [Pristionchus fissidentatus]
PPSSSSSSFTSFDPFATYHKATQEMFTEPSAKVTIDSLNIDMLTASIHGDKKRMEECLSLLRLPSTIYALGDIEYERIGLLHEIDFIKQRRQVRIILQSIVYANIKGQTVGQFANLIGFNFVQFVDNCKPLNPFSLKRLDNTTFLRLIRWAYLTDSLLVLAEIEKFLLSESGSDLFNEYQLLHLAHRFDMPQLRMRCLSSLRSIEDIEDFSGDDNYDAQLSEVDHSLLKMRADHLIHLRSLSLSPDANFFLWDFHSGCTFEESIETRYFPVDQSMPDESNQKMSSGFSDDAEVAGLF